MTTQRKTTREEVDRFCSQLRSMVATWPVMRIGELIFLALGEKDLFYMSNDDLSAAFSSSANRPLSESRKEKIARLEASGDLVRECLGCWVQYEHPTLDAFAPRHRASARCESGQRDHCTCDTCF